MVRSAQSCASSSFPDTTPASLALQACDDADHLRQLLRAYACLDKLIEPLEIGDTELISPTRTELSALLRVVNEEAERRIDSIDKTLQSMRSALDAKPAVQSP